MLELFLETDFERGQYKTLAALKRLRTAFRRSVLYPTLTDLEAVRKTLAETIAEFERLREAVDEPHLIEEFLRWVLPEVDEA